MIKPLTPFKLSLDYTFKNKYTKDPFCFDPHPKSDLHEAKEDPRQVCNRCTGFFKSCKYLNLYQLLVQGSEKGCTSVIQTYCLGS
jgi:hypothetical protein